MGSEMCIRDRYGTGSGLHGFVQQIKRGETIDEDFLAKLLYPVKGQGC